MARYNLFPSPTHSSRFVLSLHPRDPSSILSLGLRDTKNWSRLPHYTPLIGSGELIGQTIDHMSSESIARDTPSDVTNSSNFPLEFLNFINPVKSFQRTAYSFLNTCGTRSDDYVGALHIAACQQAKHSKIRARRV